MKITLEFNDVELTQAKEAFGNNPLDLQANPLAHVLFYEELGNFLHKLMHNTLPELTDKLFKGVVETNQLPASTSVDFDLQLRDESHEQENQSE